MNTSVNVVMGIDVCQARLDICRSDTGEGLLFANDEKGIRRLLRHLKSHPVELVVCEATGGLVQNPQVVPPSLKLAEGQADLLALDRLRPRLLRLQRLTERAADSEAALGSDLMSLSLEGYALLKVSGKNQGLENLRKELSARFAKTPKQAQPVAA